MLCLKIVFISLFLVLSVVCFEMVKNANTYGSYVIKFDHYGDCKGSRSNNLTTVALALDHRQLIGTTNVTFLVDAKIDEMKVQMYNLRDNQKYLMWNYKMNDPCKHYFIAAIIKEQFQANNCFVKKGNYIGVTNYKDVMNAFLGTTFFYGTYTYKADIASKKGNIVCFNATMTITKKSKV